jgi:hypothetical protein
MAVAVVLRGGQKPSYFNKSYPVPPLHPVGGWALARGRDRACRALGGGRRGQATFSDYGRPIPRPESSPRSGRCCGRYICRRPHPPRGIPIGQVMARRHCLGARGDVRRTPAPFPSPRSALQASHPSPPDPVSSRLTFDRGAGLLSRTGPCDDDTTNNVSWPQPEWRLSTVGMARADIRDASTGRR